MIAVVLVAACGSSQSSNESTENGERSVDEGSMSGSPSTDAASEEDFTDVLKERLCRTIPVGLIEVVVPGAVLDEGDLTGASWYGDSVLCSFVAADQELSVSIVAAPDAAWGDHASTIDDLTVAGFPLYEGDHEFMISPNGVPIIVARSAISGGSNADEIQMNSRLPISLEEAIPILQFVGERWKESYPDYCSAVRLGELDISAIASPRYGHAAYLCDLHSGASTSSGGVDSNGELCAAALEAIKNVASSGEQRSMDGLVVTTRRSDGSVLGFYPGDEYTYWQVGYDRFQQLSSDEFVALRTEQSSTETEFNAVVAADGAGFTCSEELTEVGE